MWVALQAAILFAATIEAAELHVMISGGFTAPYKLLAPQFENRTRTKLETVRGPSMGSTLEAIPNRLARGEQADVVILARGALDALVRQGQVIPESVTDLAKSRIGLAVKAGAPVPDISTVQALKQTLLHARSIAYSDSASGVYIANELFKRLGIEAEVASKSRMVPQTPVGEIVARGEAEIGFQQLSELLPVAGIRVVGPIPDPVQRVTAFSAGILKDAKSPEEARKLIRFLTSRQARRFILRYRMEPVALLFPKDLVEQQEALARLVPGRRIEALLQTIDVTS